MTINLIKYYESFSEEKLHKIFTSKIIQDNIKVPYVNNSYKDSLREYFSNSENVSNFELHYYYTENFKSVLDNLSIISYKDVLDIFTDNGLLSELGKKDKTINIFELVLLNIFEPKEYTQSKSTLFRDYLIPQTTYYEPIENFHKLKLDKAYANKVKEEILGLRKTEKFAVKKQQENSKQLVENYFLNEVMNKEYYYVPLSNKISKLYGKELTIILMELSSYFNRRYAEYLVSDFQYSIKGKELDNSLTTLFHYLKHNLSMELGINIDKSNNYYLDMYSSKEDLEVVIKLGKDIKKFNESCLIDLEIGYIEEDYYGFSDYLLSSEWLNQKTNRKPIFKTRYSEIIPRYAYDKVFHINIIAKNIIERIDSYIKK